MIASPDQLATIVPGDLVRIEGARIQAFEEESDSLSVRLHVAELRVVERLRNILHVPHLPGDNAR